MEIIEKLTMSKTGSSADNEDALWVGENFCLVADGVTSKCEASCNGRSGGQIAVDCIVSTLAGLSGSEDARAVFTAIQDSILSYIQDNAVPESVKIQASVLIYSVQRQELWSVGDCQYYIGARYCKSEKKSDAVLSGLRSMIIRSLLLDGYTVDSLLREDVSRKQLLPFLKLQSGLLHTDDTFGACVVDEHPVSQITVHSVPLGSELVLASDGYPFLYRTLAESEQALAELLEQDPLCYRLYLSTKGKTGNNLSYDDRTYLRIRT